MGEERTEPITVWIHRKGGVRTDPLDDLPNPEHWTGPIIFIPEQTHLREVERLEGEKADLAKALRDEIEHTTGMKSDILSESDRAEQAERERDEARVAYEHERGRVQRLIADRRQDEEHTRKAEARAENLEVRVEAERLAKEEGMRYYKKLYNHAQALTRALAFYAEVREYNRVGGDPPDAPPPILTDKGSRARTALAELSPPQDYDKTCPDCGGQGCDYCDHKGCVSASPPPARAETPWEGDPDAEAPLRIPSAEVPHRPDTFRRDDGSPPESDQKRVEG